MTTEQMRKAHQTRPSVPFAIRTGDGREFPVPHPEFLYITPPGRTVIVSDSQGAVKLIDFRLASSLHFESNGGQRRRRRGD